MSIHLISDLHLSEDTPQLIKLFQFYMRSIAPRSEQLFVLGDLFEVWVGDDYDSPISQLVVDEFRAYSEQNKSIFIAHGNRDFLLGNRFARRCGAKLIEQPYLLEWQGKKICLMHGDQLCIDDTSYQEFRQMVRDKQWQQDFLALPVKQRLAIASSIRSQSKNSQQQKDMQIMDVNQAAVQACFKQHQCDWLIHGHTHRPDVHSLEFEGITGKRLVLSDWGEQGHFVELKDKQFQSHYFADGINYTDCQG